MRDTDTPEVLTLRTYSIELASGEHFSVQELPAFDGVRIVIAGDDGSAAATLTAAEWYAVRDLTYSTTYSDRGPRIVEPEEEEPEEAATLELAPEEPSS